MQLFSREVSPFAARVRISILAKQLPVQIIDDPEVSSATFGKLNPLRRVPVLVLDDGTSIVESDTIVEYLEEAFPATSLRPTDPLNRARVRLIARVAELYVFPAVVPIFMARASGDARRLDELFDALDGMLGQLASFLDDTGWHAWGDRLTTADGALAPFLFYVDFVGKACARNLIAKHVRLQRFWDGARNEPILATVIEQQTRAMLAKQSAKR